MRKPNEKEKSEMMQHRVEIMRQMLINGHVDVNWAIKNILGFDKKSEYRKLKISRVFNE